MTGEHRYAARLRWTGSTAAGWEHYDRVHTAVAPPAEQEVRLTTGESHGDPRILDPEQLVVMAASSCQLLFFLHLAAKARVDVREYDDDAEGVMEETDPGAPLFLNRIALRPRIVVAPGPSEERIRRLCEQAHHHCYIANSLRGEVSVEPEVVFAESP